ncbi:MAG: T9SS type A sorting domain-containing protein [Chitinophagales bacterium]|nr:T9SS type A sorting domain-containing protein [Chitinophagales bacterium]
MKNFSNDLYLLLKKQMSFLGKCVSLTIVYFSFYQSSVKAQAVSQPAQIAWGRYFDDTISDSDFAKEDLGERIYYYLNDVFIVGRSKSDTLGFANCDGSYSGGSGDAFVASYNPSCQKYNWIRYFGSSASTEYAYCAALDRVGDQTWIYIAGEVNGTKKQVNIAGQACVGGCSSVFQTTNNDKWDGFIAKYNAVTGQLVRWTFFGGIGRDQILGIAVDTISHKVYFNGYTESPAWLNYSSYSFTPFKSDLSGVGDMFIGCLDSCLNTLQYFSYYGGNNSDRGHDIQIIYKNAARYLILSGTTESSTGIVPPGSNYYDNTYGGGTDGKSPDAFMLIWNIKNLSNNPDWSTYFGGSAADRGRGTDITRNYDIYWTGQTQSSPDNSGTFSPTSNAYQPQKNLGIDCFLTKFHISSFNPVTVSLDFFTYFGGEKDDFAKSVRAFHSNNSADGRDSVAIAGLTYSADLPSKDSTAYFLSKSINGNNNENKRDAFIAVLTNDPANPTANQKLSSFMYLGGENDETDIKQNDVLVQKSYNPGLESGPNGSLFIIYSTKGIKTKKNGNIPIEYSAFHCPAGGCNSQNSIQPDAYFAQVYPFPQRFIPSQCLAGKMENATSGNELINFYPVPFSNYTILNINLNEDKDADVVIYDILGNIVIHKNLSLYAGDNKINLDFSDYAKGVYLSRINLAGKIYENKIIKQ